MYLFYINFGVIDESGWTNFQILLATKGFLGGWLGLRGVLQVFFGIQPLVFKKSYFSIYFSNYYNSFISDDVWGISIKKIYSAHYIKQGKL